MSRTSTPSVLWSRANNTRQSPTRNRYPGTPARGLMFGFLARRFEATASTLDVIRDVVLASILASLSSAEAGRARAA